MDKDVERIVASYVGAAMAKDVEAFMRLYDPSVRVFDTWGMWSYEGASAWRVAVEGWFTSLGTERVRVTFSDLRTSGENSFAMVSAVVTYTAESAQGDQLRSMQNRLTWVLRESGHVYRIAHEHTSVPIAFEDGKGILHQL